MKRRAAIVLLTWLGLILVPVGDLFAQCYSLSTATGSRTTGNFTNLGFTHRTGNPWGGVPTDSRVINIGFTFQYNGTSYTTLRVYHNGIVVPGGGTIISPTFNQLQSTGAPAIAPFWDEMRITDNMRSQGTGCSASNVSYLLTGSSPNRVLVIDWDQIGLGQNGNGFRSPLTFQLRLHETGRIEFWYSAMNGQSDGCSMWGSGFRNSNASIGLTYTGGFTSVTPVGGSSATSSSVTPNDYIDIASTPITSGTVYSFISGSLTGNVAQGGTAGMLNGDTLLLGKRVTLSSFQTFNPFTLISPCASTVTYTITGPNAADYTVTPAVGPLPPTGSTPTIRFAPTGIGRRYATLTLVAGTVNRNYVLAAEGVPRTTWIGNIPQGGTTGMRDGDTLMRNIGVPHGTSQSFTPFSILVPSGSNIPAPMTYTLTDPTGQFSISPTSQVITPGSSAIPTITFSPTGIGWQQATLRVNAEGEIRTFLLRAFARGSGAIVTVNGELVRAGLPIFRNSYSCVGTEANTVLIQVENIGDEPFLFYDNNAYKTDDEIRQGTPPYELLRDEFGNLVQVADYYFSLTPGSTTPVSMPLAVPPFTTQSVYLSFVPTRPGKRQSRAYFRTNGMNFNGIDTLGNTTRGILNFELVGTGLGSKMTNKAGDKMPDAIVFPPTDVRSTTRLTGYVRNSGECDMLIRSADFRLVSGDVNEFKVVSELKSPKDAKGNFVIPPGQLDSFDVEFTPTRSGSRRASLWLRSNDSGLVRTGVSELGVYYLDVFGVGKVGLEGRMVKLPPAVIGGPGSVGRAILENTSGEVVEVTNITMIGGNGEIIEDPANTWRPRPFKLSPGQTQNLALVFNVPSGAPGLRTAALEVTLSGGTVLTIDIEGLAGTRELAVAPTNLFQGITIDVGNVRRQFVAVTNTGTFPVSVQELRLTETNPGDYLVSPLVRGTMEPGQIEFYEVTYAPQSVGLSSGTLEIISNSTNGPHIVVLGGEGSVIAPVGGGMGSTIAVTGDEDAVAVRPSSGLSGWEASMENGTLLWPSSPNPTGGRTEVRYYLPSDSDVEMTLYTSNGEMVKRLVSGMEVAGEHQVTIDVRDLSSGRYYYTLRTTGGALTLSVDVVK